MMHRLLKRQLRKHLGKDLSEYPESCERLLEAIGRSYSDYDDKIAMIQRAMSISSDELFEANRQLVLKNESQQRILDSLEQAMAVAAGSGGDAGSGAAGRRERLKPEALAVHAESQALELLSVTRQRNDLLHELEFQNEALENYAHLVSHDLKSALRNIHTLITWIKEDSGVAESWNQPAELAMVLENVEKMDAIVDGILRHATLMRIQEKRPLDSEKLLRRVIDSLEVPDHVNIRLGSGMPVVSGEANMLEQVFKNLIHNSLRAVMEQSVPRIDIEVSEVADQWVFEVRDNGRGIPERFRTAIFEMFKKIDNDQRTTGMGLALVKKIVGLHGGRIWIDSEEDQGTSVFFTLPKNTTDGAT